MLLILQIAALAVTVAVGIFAFRKISEMRDMYADQQNRLLRTIAAIEEFPKLHREFILFLRRIEADSQELQKIALQIEAAAAATDERIKVSSDGAAQRQTAAIESLRDYLDAQEQRLAAIAETISESITALMRPRETALEERADNANHSRYRREGLGRNPELRFAVLKDWLAVNALAILRRASRPWKTADDLIGNIPSYLLPEAEILDNCILLVGTREHSDRLALPFRELDFSSDYRQWFEHTENGSTLCAPAVLIRSNGHYTLLSKGANSPSFAGEKYAKHVPIENK